MLVCGVQTHPEKYVLDHANPAAPIRQQHDLGHTDLPEMPRSSSGDRLSVRRVECLGVIDVEAHAAHCRMASKTTTKIYNWILDFLLVCGWMA